MFTTDFPFRKPFNETIPEDGSVVRSGVGEVVYHLALELEKLGHEIVIVSTSANGVTTTEQTGKIKLIRYGKTLKIAETDVSIRYLFGVSNADFDIIHLHSGSPPATVAALNTIRRDRSVPFIITHHLDPSWHYGSIVRRLLTCVYGKYYLMRTYAKSDKLIALSKAYLDQSVFLQTFSARVKVIPNGIDVKDYEVSMTKDECRNKLQIPENAHVILFLGNLTQRKGPHLLVHAMKRIVEQDPSVKLVLAGAKSDSGDTLISLVKQLNIEENVVFMGPVDEATKLLCYKAADIFSLPSYSEAYPLSVLEAAACGLPIVVSNLSIYSGIIVDGFNGLLFETGDYIDLSKKILYLLNALELREGLGKNLYATVKENSWENIAILTEKEYMEIL
jgi:glycosyltransferase involved in cell wall biosynthesis